MKSTLIIPGIYFSMTSCSFGTDERKFNFLEDNHCQFTPLDVVAYSEYVTPTGQTQNFQFKSFMFYGPPYTGLHLNCTLKLCIKMNGMDGCPKVDESVCPAGYNNLWKTDKNLEVNSLLH